MRLVYIFAVYMLSQGVCAQVAVEGSVPDVLWFGMQVEKLKKQSAAFSDLWSQMENYTSNRRPRITIQVRPNSKAFLFGVFDRQIYFSLSPTAPGKTLPPSPLLDYSAWRDGNRVNHEGWSFQVFRTVLAIDRADIEALPVFEPSGEDWRVSGGKPAWAITQESVLAHEISEFYHGLGNNHCKYSCDCPGGEEDDSHHVGKLMENAVRGAFGQSDMREEGCGDQQIPRFKVGDHRVELEVKESDLVEVRYPE